MLLVFSGSSFFFNFFIGVFSALLISRFIEPLYDSILDYLKNNNGLIGKLYNWYSRFIGHLFYSKKLHPSLKKRGWEYKIYIDNGNIKCYRSTILILRQTLFGRIQGEMDRISFSKNSFRTYFRAYVKSKDKNYLIWEERYKSNEGYLHINAQYKLRLIFNNDIVGQALEQHDGKIINSFNIISFSETPYTSVKRIYETNSDFVLFLKSHNINIENITLNSNTIIIS